MRDAASDRDAAANGCLPCAGCPDDYAPPGEDYCFACYHAPYGPAWQEEQEARFANNW